MERIYKWDNSMWKITFLNPIFVRVNKIIFKGKYIFILMWEQIISNFFLKYDSILKETVPFNMSGVISWVILLNNNWYGV